MYLEPTEEAQKFYEYYIASDGNFNTLLKYYIKKDQWVVFLKELERILYLFESKFKHLQGNDSIAYKYDFIDFLVSSKSEASKTKYTKKIDEAVNEVSKIKPYVVLKCEDILVCSLSIGDNYSSYMPAYHFKKDNDIWYKTRKENIEKSGSLLQDDKKIILKTLDKLNNIRETFLGVTKYCFKAYDNQDPHILFNPNIEILENLGSLQDIVSEIYNTSFEKSSTYLENLKTYILAIMKDFYENLKHKYALDFQKIHYHEKLEKFKKELNNLEFSKLKEITLYDQLPETLQKNKTLTIKEKILLHFLIVKFGDSNLGVQRVYRFLKNNSEAYNVYYNLSLKDFNYLINYCYNFSFKTTNKEKEHHLELYETQIKKYLDSKLYEANL